MLFISPQEFVIPELINKLTIVLQVRLQFQNFRGSKMLTYRKNNIIL